MNQALEFCLKSTGKLDRALGSVIGAFIGDSMGSYCEFRGEYDESYVLEALKMPGGGVFSLSPGQLTDDSELAINLAKGLIDGNGRFSPEFIVKNYLNWLASEPFDVGTQLEKLFKI